MSEDPERHEARLASRHVVCGGEMNEGPEIRVVLVTSEGRAFCSGLDLTELVDGEISARWFHEA